MYQLHISVHETVGAWAVQFAFSVTDDRGRTRPLGTRSLWLENIDPRGDALIDALEIARRACTLELRPNR